METQKSTEEMRSAVRFPINLPVAVKGSGSEMTAETKDISAGGVLFQMQSDVAVGSAIEFRIVMPATVLGTPADVNVHCFGRVVRVNDADGSRMVAAVIDEYRFERS